MPLWVELALLVLCILVGARLVGTGLAAVPFDQTGTTRIGKYPLNQGFMRPELAATVTATFIAPMFYFVAQVGP